ncbi:MAG: MBL fold metallo-hydrolase [Parcubacteria group bacterium]|nr:MBL fold metallo-hydrolase [Parcubacteria group bacterium]
MRILGRSKAIHSTWFFLPEYKVLLDAGEGASSTLGIHTSDIEYVFISHTHLDHIAGLLTISRFQKRTLDNEPNRVLCRVLYHPGCRNQMDKIKRFLKDFGASLEFIEIEENQDFEIKKNIFIKPFLVEHTAPYYREKLTAIGCHLIERRRRLVPQYAKIVDDLEKKHKDAKMARQEISAAMLDLKKKVGEEALHESYERIMLSYCGDCEPVNPQLVRGTEILMHESTFITKAEMEAAHSSFEDVVRVAKEAQCKALVVYHLSERYKRELPQYKDIMEKIAKRENLQCPLYIVGIDEFFRAKI